MPRAKMPAVSPQAEELIKQFEAYLSVEQDLNARTVRSYLSDLRQFCAWYETVWYSDDPTETFAPSHIATPTITRYRAYLQTELTLKPATINRHLVSLKRFFEWALNYNLIERDPSRTVKLLPEVFQPPRQLSDREESALVAAVENHGSLRDQTILILLLHTGLRAMELCSLKPEDITLHKRSGVLRVVGKRSKYREVPLNATARQALEIYFAASRKPSGYLFPSEKTNGRLSERALRYIVSKYAYLAKLEDVSPHDLRHRFGYRMAEKTPLQRLAHIMGHDSLDTTMIYVQATKRDLQSEVEKIAWD